MDKPWLQHYPAGVPAELPAFPYRSLAELLDEAFAKNRDKPAFHFLGATKSFGEIDEASRAFAAYLQSLGLKKGDRVSLMMPNVFQYPVAVAGILRAGMVVVNTNPLYTPRELAHQLSDSGAKALVILENMAKTFQACRSETPVEHVVVASMGDMLPTLKGHIVNFVVRRLRKMVPAYDLPGAVTFKQAMAKGRAGMFRSEQTERSDVAVLQYTGGTTGVAKGATLTHGNIIANVLQSELWNQPALRDMKPGEQQLTVCALPLYHIFGFTVNMMLSMRNGGCNILIPNPRDIKATLKELKKHRFHSFPAVNTLFGAIARHPDVKDIDWSSLKLSVGGGMAVQAATAELWRQKTGCSICEGYGLSETSPSASCNPTDATEFSGTIGMPLPSTEFRIIDEAGKDLPVGERGEIAIRGPQVMVGYWNRPDETARVMTEDGFFRTGDIGVMDERGYFKIVDRKKDMINVSGFNVYPNEIEEVATRMPGIAEAAAIAMTDDNSGEAVKLFVVATDPAITEEAVKAFCRDNLTGYKRPREVVFRDELPKSGVGKVLRRELRD
ncbi:long-chain-fatty-acid--CoA ligase [Aurantimonas endophytica]|uniref:Long-chain-fatty-acid--CoA ligase n=1 Tax=Aurantimonas endophytica TaxID=1522175 RepID=A0A7W6MR04_9HYPH|nr:long-chain-fatty-acid--CoA ligase [Aurantimonas endophytica]MBB4004473.1 long-chain acyl-CoA synthetase [Aurantimonas endophytica]MCO6405309.1 long-chain-fatty-acid--CoA ligase [Aurantimonas endophytica]